MLGKIWKKIGLLILIIVCLWNIIYKITNIISFDNAINSAKIRIQEIKNQSRK